LDLSAGAAGFWRDTRQLKRSLAQNNYLTGDRLWCSKHSSGLYALLLQRLRSGDPTAEECLPQPAQLALLLDLVHGHGYIPDNSVAGFQLVSRQTASSDNGVVGNDAVFRLYHLDPI